MKASLSDTIERNRHRSWLAEHAPMKTSARRWLIRLVVVGLIVSFLWALFGLHVDEPQGPISAAKAEAVTGVPLPPEAINIRAASYNQWIGYERFLRFEAPPDICLRYMSAVVPVAASQPADDWDLAANAKPMRADVFSHFNWFDLDKAQKVVTAGGGPSLPQVWVDQARGVFYYRKTD